MFFTVNRIDISPIIICRDYTYHPNFIEGHSIQNVFQRTCKTS